MNQGSAAILKQGATFWVLIILPKTTSLIHTSEIKNMLNFVLSINKINDIHLCEETDHVNTIL